MYYNSFDIVEAHYWHAVDYHGGQWSAGYRKLCRIAEYYEPSILHKGYASLSDNGKEIYNALVNKTKGESQ